MGKHVDAERATGYLSTDSNKRVPDGWVELTRKQLIPGEMVRRSYVGPLVTEMDTLVGVEIGGKREWFAKSAWHVTPASGFSGMEGLL